jgi:DNA helicase HerA-like ATPase
VAAFYRVAHRLRDENQSGVSVSPATVRDELKLLAATATVTNRLDERLATALQVRCQQAADLELWLTDVDQSNAASYLEGKSKLVALDIPAVSKGVERSEDELKRVMILLAYLLESIWDLARKQWDQAVSSKEKVDRNPTFIVIDEAHNFVPNQEPKDPLARRISGAIQRIAAEGRKYGLHLLLVTQRPQKIREGLLWECENLCLLRLQSPADLRFAKRIWGFKATNEEMIPKFSKGRGLLFGAWTEGEALHFQGGRRRTEETGGDLGDSWIMKR